MPTDLLLLAPEVMADLDRLLGAMEVDFDAAFLLGHRGSLMDLRSHGRMSAGGSCRLLPTTDGWVAINLARASDVQAVPAIVGEPGGEAEPWETLAQFAQSRTAEAVADRCQLLGVPGAVLADSAVRSSAAVTVHEMGQQVRQEAERRRRPQVIDLSSMWAGPLCAHLLGKAGMDVLKVESEERPDGARFGDRQFFEWLQDGHDEVALRFGSEIGRQALIELLEDADVVIEASRPRALQQLGIDARDVVSSNPGITWVSITGYGRSGDRGNWIAFGDDAAVAGGLVDRDDRREPVFCGDAIADPLTGVVAADAALRSVEAGGGCLVEVRMAAVARMFAEGLR